MRFIVRLFVFAALMAGGVFVGTVPAQAATLPFVFSGIYYNSPGADDRSNASLNAEYVKLTSKFGRTESLKGYTLKDASGHTYTFGDVKVKGHESLWLRTGKGTNTAYTLFWNRTAYVWNNDEDKGTLRDPAGKVMDTCSYSGSKTKTNC